jgi:hypothetical protein
MDIQEVGGGCGDWMELAQDRDWWALVSTGFIKCGEFFDWLQKPVSFSRRTVLCGVSE